MLEMFFSFQCTKYDENRWHAHKQLSRNFLKVAENKNKPTPKMKKNLFLPYSIHSINDDAKELPGRTDVDSLPT